MSTGAGGDEAPVRVALDPESEGWVIGLTSPDSNREAAAARLHAVLLRAARREASRRQGVNGIIGAELDDLAHQAASDALVSILAKVGEFRGESRFTTWAHKFVVYEVSNKFGRHVWRRERVRLDADSWERLPDRVNADPTQVAESRELVAVVRAAVAAELTPHQRQVFVAIVLEATPLDALALELGTTRAELYKTMFEARRKLRAHLVALGYLETSPRGHG